MRQSQEKKNRVPILRERLNELLGDMTTTDFAEKIGISRQTMGFYLNGDRIPDSETLIKICNACNVSADWLLGLSGDRSRTPSAVDTLGLSPAVVDGITRIKNQSQTLRSSFSKTKASQQLPMDPLSGLNTFLEDTLPTGLYNEIYMFTREVEREAQSTPSALEVESEDIYSKYGKLRGDTLVMHELEGILIEKYPELAGRITVQLASYNLKAHFDGIMKLFSRCLAGMTGYNKVVK